MPNQGSRCRTQMSDVPVIPLVDEGLGNSTYLVDLGDRRGPPFRPPRPGRRGRQSSADLSGREVVVMCGHGERAASAANVLERAGVTDVAILFGGPQDWADAGAERTLQVDE